MKAPCTLTRLPTGVWLVRHSSPALGTLQYRIELCPCSEASADTVVLQVEEER